MNSQQRFCTKCGNPIGDGQSFCTSCGAPAQSQPQYYPQNPQPTYTAPQANARPRKRKTYTAQKFIAMGFAIGDLVFAFAFWICGLIYSDAAYLYDYSLDFEDYYYSSTDMMSEMFDVLAGVMYFLAAVLFIGSIVAWIMFGVYSKKRRNVMAQIALEKQQGQAQTYNLNQM